MKLKVFDFKRKNKQILDFEKAKKKKVTWLFLLSLLNETLLCHQINKSKHIIQKLKTFGVQFINKIKINNCLLNLRV